MSDLSYLEKSKLEKLLQMGGGYVLNFSNRTFAEFVLESTGKNIWDHKYDHASGSKANRLRRFWAVEPNPLVGKLIADLLAYCEPGPDQGRLYDECHRIVQRLQQSAPVSEIDAIAPDIGGRGFEVLARSVRESIDKNEPEAGIDRLHTFVVKYIRMLCKKHGVSTEQDKPLHGLVGEYVKRLKGKGLIESPMTERILRSSIVTLEAFNRVRNEQSLAHDNPILNYNESLLILNHVASTIRFIRALEESRAEPERTTDEVAGEGDDIPF